MHACTPAARAVQMHDGPVRMLAKGMLRAIVPWRQSRAFFAARLRRRLTEEALLKHIAGGRTARRSAARRTAAQHSTAQRG